MFAIGALIAGFVLPSGRPQTAARRAEPETKLAVAV